MYSDSAPALPSPGGESGWKVREQPDSLERGGGALGDRAGGLVTPSRRVGNIGTPQKNVGGGAVGGSAARSGAAAHKKTEWKELGAPREMGEVIFIYTHFYCDGTFKVHILLL